MPTSADALTTYYAALLDGSYELIYKIPDSRRYTIPPQAIRTMAALMILREKVLRPILAGVGKPKFGRKPSNWSTLDEHYEAIRQQMFTLMEDLRIAA